ncbi:hypothetical protein KEM48_011145 [Puccinia striiformis f. sp. tritici PST-130]|nr:hypothetical protein KEM48_011145 [Puccinia striiformis f. sp. tritici PST-130]
MAGQIPNVATSATTHSGLGFLPLDRSPSSPSSLLLSKPLPAPHRHPCFRYLRLDQPSRRYRTRQSKPHRPHQRVRPAERCHPRPARVNSTSSLQLDSLMYRFHPSVKWSNQFPVRKGEILSELQKVWNNYRLSSRTRLNFTVEQVSRQEVPDGQPSKWTINNGVDGVFDGILVAVGTCGPAERVKLEGRERFQGKMVHSSELDQIDWPGKRVVSGCTTPAVLVTRTDKWFIPRNLIIGTLLAMNPFGVPCFIDNIAEGAIRAYHYGADLKWMSPAAYNGKPADRLYSKTPIVNGEFLKLVRENRADYVRAKDVISGDVCIGGRKPGVALQCGTAYCEQQDVHDRTATIREAL